MLGDRWRFRAAIAASLGVHTVLAGGVILVGKWIADPASTPRVALDTRTNTNITMTFHDVEVAVDAPSPAVDISPPPTVTTIVADTKPVTQQTPRILPADVLAQIGKAATFLSQIQPVGRVEPPMHLALDGGAPLHGALAQGQTIVYVLDASGSMGQAGKFDRARRALVATLRLQPPDARFQIVVYSGNARVLLSGGLLTALPANVEQIAARLTNIEPLGRSAHADALKLAGHFNPEFVVVLTDGDDLPAAAVRALQARKPRAPVVSVAVVGSERVEAPRRWSAP